MGRFARESSGREVDTVANILYRHNIGFTGDFGGCVGAGLDAHCATGPFTRELSGPDVRPAANASCRHSLVFPGVVSARVWLRTAQLDGWFEQRRNWILTPLGPPGTDTTSSLSALRRRRSGSASLDVPRLHRPCRESAIQHGQLGAVLCSDH